MPSDVIIVEAPFLSVVRPALGASALVAALRAHGIDSEVAYLNMLYAERRGIDFCEYISERAQTNLLIGEWIFAGDINPDPDEAAQREYRAWIASYLSPGHMKEVLAARADAPVFCAEMAARLVETGAPIIGFSTTFQQNCASLSIAKRVKALSPETVICFGGANCDGPMGPALADAFPWIDYVFQGEADTTFPDFVQTLLAGGTPPTIEGSVYTAGAGAEAAANTAAQIVDMDALPIPVFDDYFGTLDRAGFRDRVVPGILFESSRGCWWGAKHHCTFCGLNGASMTYRSKSAERVLDEIDAHHRTWDVHNFEAADNIMNMRHISGVFDVLAERGTDHRFFYEIKSNMKPDHLHRIAKGGVTWVQAGVENLDDDILAKMEKGVNGLQNLRMLRSCAEIGIRALWNLLCGFPGETAEQYREMAELMPLIEHLDPPTGYCPIRLDRFSPYFERADELGFRNVRTARAYKPVYGLPDEVLSQIAYFFEGDPDGVPDGDYLAPVASAIATWRAQHIGQTVLPDLRLIELGPIGIIKDTRRCAVDAFRVLSPDERAVLDACRELRSAEAVVQDDTLAALPRDEAASILQRMIDLRYIVTNPKGMLLNVVLYPDLAVNAQDAYHEFPGGWLRDAAKDAALAEVP